MITSIGLPFKVVKVGVVYIPTLKVYVLCDACNSCSCSMSYSGRIVCRRLLGILPISYRCGLGQLSIGSSPH